MYWQVLHPEKIVIRSAVLQVRGRKSSLLLGVKLWDCSAARTRTE